MPFKSIFHAPEGGVMAGLITAAAVALIYNSALPLDVDIRANGQANDNMIDAARKGAAVKSSGLVALVFLITRDLNTFIIGGATIVGLDYYAKHHNAVNPNTGKFDTGSQNVAPSNVFSLPDYGASESMSG
jgi:hypothetical protein